MMGRRKAVVMGTTLAAVLAMTTSFVGAQPSLVPATGAVRYLDQGPNWKAADRQGFYAQDQGSQIIPLAWAKALQAPDGTPFLSDRLARYGYLRDEARADLPVGFTSATRAGIAYLGMSCAACHTRQIEVEGAAYRIDGGPALSDFQSFLSDLDSAVGLVLSDGTRFDAFASTVLGAGAAPDKKAALKAALGDWYRRQHILFSRALPANPWGLGRLDAVSMIFNRVSGLDIGTAPDGIIAANIQSADAPVRYPFIWNAPKQDRTQWPGFAENGDALLGLARNLGEVYGVFADFHPVKTNGPLGYDYHTRNSANFSGLRQLERHVRKIGAPVWPWPLDQAAVDRGKALYATNCFSCHGETHGKTRLVPFTTDTWKTPVMDVGTDTRQYDILARTADTGVLKGARSQINHQLGAQDKQFNILAAAVIGSLLDWSLHPLRPDGPLAPPFIGDALVPHLKIGNTKKELYGVYHAEVAQGAVGGQHPYEARVLYGIWATAPYLHNGSVASLAELLTPPDQRQAAFAVGPAYDRATVGLAKVQPGPQQHWRQTTGCDQLNSGDSHCGHPYGTQLSANQKSDLLEYLKKL